MNRPEESISFEMMLEGLCTFRRQFGGEFWLEIMLLADITDTDEEVARLAEHVERILPGRVQLNTAVRPPAESSAMAVAPERMDQLATRFRPPAEVIAQFRHLPAGGELAANRQSILALLRRPAVHA